MTQRSGAPRLMRGQPKLDSRRFPLTHAFEKLIITSKINLQQSVRVEKHSFETSPVAIKCSENCILYLRNRHVVILSSLKLWERGTVSIFVLTKFPFSIYVLDTSP